MNPTIRLAKTEDSEIIFELLEELASHTGDLTEIEITPLRLAKDLAQKRFFALVAEADGEIIGCALFGNLYSTYKGLGLYMTDLVVSGSHRGNGIGQQLFHAVVSYADEGKYSFLKWQYLPQNELAQQLYKRFDPSIDDKRWTCSISKNNFDRF